MNTSHSVAFGIFISELLDIEDLFQLVAAEYSVASDNKVDVNNEPEIHKNTLWNIKLHDDIMCPYGKKFTIRASEFLSLYFTYMGNDKIKIGKSCCGPFMIFAAHSESTDTFVSCDVDEKTITDLCNWSRKLVKETRLTNSCLKLISLHNYSI